MRFLVDQNLPVSIAQRLSDVGRDAQHTSSVGLGHAEDSEIFVWCRTHECALLTGDKKLTKFLASESATSPTVVVVRGYYEDKELLLRDLVDNLGLIEATVTEKGHAVFSIGADRLTRVQLLPLATET